MISRMSNVPSFIAHPPDGFSEKGSPCKERFPVFSNKIVYASAFSTTVLFILHEFHAFKEVFKEVFKKKFFYFYIAGVGSARCLGPRCPLFLN